MDGTTAAPAAAKSVFVPLFLLRHAKPRQASTTNDSGQRRLQQPRHLAMMLIQNNRIEQQEEKEQFLGLWL